MKQFDITWQHVKGKENVVADILSRLKDPEKKTYKKEDILKVMEIQFESPVMKKLASQIKREQDLDPKINKILKCLGEPNLDLPNNLQFRFTIYKNILFKYIKETNIYQIYIPDCMRLQIIKAYHQEGGHIGYKRLVKEIEEHCYIKNINRLAAKVAKLCELCQLVKPNSQLMRNNYQRFIPENQLQHIYIDVCGPLPTSNTGQRYILILIDGFSRYLKVYSLQKVTSTCILNKIINQYIVQVGKPKYIIADQATQFRSRKWIARLNRAGILMRHSSPYNPQANLAERAIKEIMRVLRTYCAHQHRQWPKFLTYCELIHNCSYHETIGVNPTFVHTGKHPQRIIEKYIQFPTPDKVKCLTMEEIRQKVHTKLLHTFEKRRQKLEKKGKITILNIGDKVMLRSTLRSDKTLHFSRKLNYLWSGPYIIQGRTEGNAYQLMDIYLENIGVYNIRRLKRFYD